MVNRKILDMRTKSRTLVGWDEESRDHYGESNFTRPMDDARIARSARYMNLEGHTHQVNSF